MDLTKAERQSLLAAALAAREHAYAPYSDFRVGAAILVAGGDVVVGSNVENASYGLTICAERAAVCVAVSTGSPRLRAVAIASEGGCPPPCGACRQVLAEFNKTLPILLVDSLQHDHVEELNLSQLLPHGFSFPFQKPERSR